MNELDRPPIFVQRVREIFSFLVEMGFAEVEVLPTLVRFRKGDVEVDVYHGRDSFEVGGGIAYSGTRYAMSEIVRALDPAVAKRYKNPVASEPELMTTGLEELAASMKRYGLAALSGDSQFFSKLEDQRKAWANEYSLDVLTDQLRPQAEDAFRRGDYSKAAEFYGRIRERLSPAEVKKLAFAEARCEHGPL